MKVDVLFSFAHVLNIAGTLAVQLGQKFYFSAEPGPVKLSWFSNNDAVLKITEASTGDSVAVEATGTGDCTILIMNEQGTEVLKRLSVTCADPLELPAGTITAEFAPPELK